MEVGSSAASVWHIYNCDIVYCQAYRTTCVRRHAADPSPESENAGGKTTNDASDGW
jgi:hypothetical protein